MKKSLVLLSLSFAANAGTGWYVAICNNSTAPVTLAMQKNNSFGDFGPTSGSKGTPTGYVCNYPGDSKCKLNSKEQKIFYFEEANRNFGENQIIIADENKAALARLKVSHGNYQDGWLCHNDERDHFETYCVLGDSFNYQIGDINLDSVSYKSLWSGYVTVSLSFSINPADSALISECLKDPPIISDNIKHKIKV